MKINLKDTFNKELPSDADLSNSRRQVFNACFSFVTPRIPSNAKLIHCASDFASEIGFLKEDITSIDFLNTFSGTTVYPSTNPFAMCYGGHQFGNWAGQLGDGRAINLFELEYNNSHWAIQLKGAGETPYSRTADGLAVLRSSIREHLCSEAMQYLGVPTTRSLSLVLTGDEVLRDVMYNGNSAYEKGAIVCRVAPSFIRFGNFQILAAHQDLKTLKEFTDYTVKHFFSHIKSSGKEAYLQFYKEVVATTMQMIVEWQRVGFVHGVMNTDNMSILGLTIDYGPYGWLEDYDPDWTPNTTDAQGKRYRFKNQPDIAMWNLIQLANAIYTLIDDAPALEEILNDADVNFEVSYRKMRQDKLGLTSKYDNQFHDDLESNLIESEMDMTIFYRNLAVILKSDTSEEALNKITFSFYNPNEIEGKIKENWLQWFQMYLNKLNSETMSDEERKLVMNTINPKYVLKWQLIRQFYK